VECKGWNACTFAHWVNHLALSTDFVIRTAYHDHTGKIPESEEQKVEKAKERFLKAAKIQGEVVERLISASDDFTMYLWEPSKGTKPVARMLGHQKQVNHVTFSPDGLIIASSGFDNHTKSKDYISFHILSSYYFGREHKTISRLSPGSLVPKKAC